MSAPISPMNTQQNDWQEDLNDFTFDELRELPSMMQMGMDISALD